MWINVWVEEIAWNLGVLRFFGGAGLVLYRVQLLGVFFVEFIAQIFKEKLVRLVKSEIILG